MCCTHAPGCVWTAWLAERAAEHVAGQGMYPAVKVLSPMGPYGVHTQASAVAAGVAMAATACTAAAVAAQVEAGMAAAWKFGGLLGVPSE